MVSARWSFTDLEVASPPGYGRKLSARFRGLGFRDLRGKGLKGLGVKESWAWSWAYVALQYGRFHA